MHDHFRQPPRRARLLTAAATLAAAATIAACGSTSSPTAPTSRSSNRSSDPSSTSPALAFSKCMRANGVPNFPDLSGFGMKIAAGSGGQAISINGVSLNGPAYQAARAKCQKYMPRHTATIPSAQAQAKQRASGLKVARCMRSHGVPNYPDPKYYGHGQVVYIPGVNPATPAFQAAAKICGFGKK